jgi:hypothetical protein
VGSEERSERYRASPDGIDAKKVAAAFKIATSSRNRRFSAFNRRISPDFSLVTPSRCPASISAWITQRRTDSFPTPTCLATACDAAVNVGYSPRCSLTRRTALAFSSGSIIFGILLILLDSNRSGIKPGALHYSLKRHERDDRSINAQVAKAEKVTAGSRPIARDRFVTVTTNADGKKAEVNGT